jgi:hypothetical protein
MFLNDLACYPDVQRRLREEIMAKQAEIGGDAASFTQDDYEAMPYLNAVLKVHSRIFISWFTLLTFSYFHG